MAPIVSAIESRVEIAAAKIPTISINATGTGITPLASRAGVAVEVFSKPGASCRAVNPQITATRVNINPNPITHRIMVFIDLKSLIMKSLWLT